MSLTQAELDKENDYYMRQASPLHDPDDGTFDGAMLHPAGELVAARSRRQLRRVGNRENLIESCDALGRQLNID